MGSKSKPNHGHWRFLLFLSILFSLIAFGLLILAGHFLNMNFVNLPPLPDMGHKILPVLNVLFLYKVGLLASVVLFIRASLNELHRMPYLFFMASFWFLVRIASMTVTPLGIPADILQEYLKDFATQSIWDFFANSLDAPNVLFFSGHTGLAFLGYLLFRKPICCGALMWPMFLISGIYLMSVGDYPFWLGGILSAIWALIFFCRKIKISISSLFLAWSFVMAATVLVTRVHYTIDVIGAYFMTAGIVTIGRYLFYKIELLCDKMERHF